MIRSMTLEQAIRTRRLECKLTQVFIADQVGLDPQAVSRWEREVARAPESAFRKLSQLLGISIETLIELRTIDLGIDVAQKARKT